MAEDQFTHVNLRLPKWMHEELRQRAAREDRSVNATIVRAVRQYLRRPAR
jgi:predicted HicB family RNase H-like nuclease